MAKNLESKYNPGQRSEDWVKVKVRSATDMIVVGYTRGENERAASFGALHIAEFMDDTLVYRGKVGTGFTDRNLASIMKNMPEEDPEVRQSLENPPRNTNRDVWVKPELIVKVNYASITKNGTFREPVFASVRNINY